MGKWYTKQQLKDIISAYNAGKKCSEISKIANKSTRSVSAMIYRMKKKGLVVNDRKIIPVREISSSSITNTVIKGALEDFSFAEIIKYLYKNGFRIKDNQLVHITETPVKLENIIN